MQIRGGVRPQPKLAQHKNRSSAYLQAKKLRQSGSVIEKMLRRVLQLQMKVSNVKFRYQYPVDPFIVGFVCLPARLIVEIDGMSHDSSVTYDLKREEYLKQQGFYIQHYSNADVIKDPSVIAYDMCQQALRLIDEGTPPRTAKPFDPPARGGCANGASDSQ